MTVSSDTDINFEILYQMFDRKSSRQRIILYLFAIRYPVTDMVSMSVADLNKLELPQEIDYCRDEIIEELDDDSAGAPVFVYPSGGVWDKRDFRRVLRQTTERHFGFPLSPARFADELEGAAEAI